MISYIIQLYEIIPQNDCAEYALPTLIDFVRKEGTSDAGIQAQRLVASYSEEVLRPYQYLLVSNNPTGTDIDSFGK